ncbi:hypothetical protein BW247_05245 [Acidihalobacter ferrooxydans]|uniref:NERD domain-containing protein n=2 Tax=Acidihalobacter ferrooxydans TaxID=1765967 RepID=A0A1P8UFP9_9GAMM|nr:hypothetical protein BW247_05245 [Acidihalobacter ferrooxydans]
MTGATFVAALSAALALRIQSYYLVLFAIACAAFAWKHYRSYRVRVFGKRLEKRAQKALKRAFKRSRFRVQCNVPCPSGGDIDALLVSANHRCAIEIKSWHGLRPGKGGLVKLNGQPLNKDPAAQTRREASSIGARAVLWMPLSKREKAFVYQGVLVIMGRERFLKRIIERSLS